MPENLPDIYTFGRFKWNVSRALEIIKQHPRKTVRVSVPALAANLGLINIDKPHTLVVDIKYPVLLGWLYSQGQWFNILIDGNHRVFRANQLHKKTIQAYVLTKEENYQALIGPAREDLNPEKTYILDYQTALNKRRGEYNYSRDDFYRQRIIEFLESINEEEGLQRALDISGIHRALTFRERMSQPHGIRFERIAQAIQNNQCPAMRTIDWILFGGQHPEAKIQHRIYLNLNAESLLPKRFCRFIRWFTKKFATVAYAKIPSPLLYRRFYQQHDSFIIYTILQDPELIHEMLDLCLDKLEKLGMSMDTEPSPFYILPEKPIATSFHLELAKIIRDLLQNISQKTSNFGEFLDQASLACETDGELTKILLAKGLIL